MAYIRAGRAVHTGRHSFVPGAAACAAAARRFPLSFMLRFAPQSPEQQNGRAQGVLSAEATRCIAPALAAQPAA